MFRVPTPVKPGDIVWAVAPRSRGEGKVRPLIIATKLTDVLRGSKIVVIACSTVFSDPPRDSEVLLPHDPEGKSRTQLREATVAVCDWVEEFPPGTEFERGGYVPIDLLKIIFKTANISVPSER